MGARSGEVELACLCHDEDSCSFSKKVGKNFRTAPYLIMHVHLTGDTLNNKAPYMDV